MSKVRSVLIFVCALMLLSSCAEPSLEEHAQKAAELTNISNQRSIEGDWSAAAKYYKDAQFIIDKYRHQDSFRDFYIIYSGYLEAGAYKQIEQYYSGDLNQGHPTQNEF